MGVSRHASARYLAGHSDQREAEPPPYRPADIAMKWGVPEQTVCALLRSGRLRGFKLQKLWLIPRANVEAYERGEVAA